MKSKFLESALKVFALFLLLIVQPSPSLRNPDLQTHRPSLQTVRAIFVQSLFDLHVSFMESKTSNLS